MFLDISAQYYVILGQISSGAQKPMTWDSYWLSCLCRNYADRVCSDGTSKPWDASHESAHQDTESQPSDVEPSKQMVCHSLHCYSCFMWFHVKVKVKAFPYSIPSVGHGADPGVQAVSLQVTVSHPPGGRLPLLSARPAVTSLAAEHHCHLAGTKLYCLVTGAHRCEQLAQGCYTVLPRVGIEPATYWSHSPMLCPLHHHAIVISCNSAYDPHSSLWTDVTV